MQIAHSIDGMKRWHLMKGTTEIHVSLGEIPTPTSLATAIFLQTMVTFTADDTVELRCKGILGRLRISPPTIHLSVVARTAERQ